MRCVRASDSCLPPGCFCLTRRGGARHLVPALPAHHFRRDEVDQADFDHGRGSPPGAGRAVARTLPCARLRDHALRTVQEYCDTVDSIYLNPVRRGLLAKPESRTWSSAAEYSGVAAEEQRRRSGLTVDPAWRDCRPTRRRESERSFFSLEAADPNAGSALPLVKHAEAEQLSRQVVLGTSSSTLPM